LWQSGDCGLAAAAGAGPGEGAAGGGGAAEQCYGRVVTAALVLHRAEQLERVRMVGLRREHLPIDRFGLGEAVVAVVRQGERNRLVDADRARLCHRGRAGAARQTL
jgi:hypothetical protein